jgi:dolichol kinase
MNYRNEVYRKMIHFGSAVFPISYYYSLSREQMLWLLGGLSALFLVGELLRMNVGPFKRFFKLIFSAVVRESEDHTITGATTVFIAGFLTVLIFERPVAIFAMLILSLADATAALIGRKWGNHSLFEKSVEGTITFLIVALALAFLLPDLPRAGAVAAAGIATIAEVLPSPIDDNLIVPLSAATTISFFYLIA